MYSILIFDLVSLHEVVIGILNSSYIYFSGWWLHTSFVAFIHRLSIFSRTTKQSSYFDVVNSVNYSLIREIICLIRSTIIKITCNPVVSCQYTTDWIRLRCLIYRYLHHLLVCTNVFVEVGIFRDRSRFYNIELSLDKNILKIVIWQLVRFSRTSKITALISPL